MDKLKMATPRCSKCNGHEFETSVNTPKGSKFRFLFVQCADCGAVLGVLDALNIGDTLVSLNNTIEGIQAEIVAIQKKIN